MVNVYLYDDVTCEGAHEYLVTGYIEHFENILTDSSYIFSPDRENLARREVMAAYGLVTPRENYIPVRIYLPNGDSRRLYKGTRLGKLEIVENTIANDSFYRVTDNAETNQQEFLSRFKLSNSNSNLTDLLWDYRDIFSKEKMDLGLSEIKHQIDTGNASPIALKPRRIPIAVEQEVEVMIQDMLENGIICRSTSPWSFPIVVVRKKTGDLRICVDYRKLNEVTRRPIYPIPDTTEVLDTLGGAKVFTCLDLSQGYHQIPMEENDKCKTAFATKSGQYEYQVMPFGLSGAPATFQRVMQTALRNETWEKCVVYLDDVLIFGKSVEEHNERLQTIFERFRSANLKLSPSKCQFLQKSVKYLGHIINENGVATDPDKIEKVKNWQTPCCHEELQAFLGLCNYYRKFIPHYSNISNPLWKILARKPFRWYTEADVSFSQLKTALTGTPILALPRKGDKYILDTDASHECIGAVLSQVQGGVERVIAYASNKMSKCQLNYCTTRKELLAAYTYILQFKHYLMGQHFTLRTDHKCLQWLLNWKRPSTSQYCLWKSELEAFEFTIEHRKGQQHGNADALSRLAPCGQCEMKHENPLAKRNVKLLENNTLEVRSVEEEQVLQIQLSPDTFFTSQLQDGEIRIIMELMKSRRVGESRPGELKIYGYTLWRYRNDLRIRGEMLYILSNNVYRLVVPKLAIKNVLKAYHDNMAHIGQSKCIGLIKERYFWCGIDKAVIDYITNCLNCGVSKGTHKRNKVQISPIVSKRPFQTLCVDITGPFNRTRTNSRYIIGMIDHFSKNVVLAPLKNMDAVTVARAIYKHWLVKYGMPETILTDNGSYFASETMKTLMKMCNITQFFSPPYHQQSNGLIERVFQTIKPLLSTVVRDSTKEWDEVLPTVELAIRSTKQKSTGFSPFEVLFGCPMRLPADIRRPEDERTADTVEGYLKYSTKVRDNIGRVISKQGGYVTPQKQYTPQPILKGDIVLIKSNVKTNNLPQEKCEGPYIVQETLGNTRLQLQAMNGHKMIVRHKNDVKKVKATCLGRAVQTVNESDIRRRGRSDVLREYPLRNRL